MVTSHHQQVREAPLVVIDRKPKLWLLVFWNVGGAIVLLYCRQLASLIRNNSVHFVGKLRLSEAAGDVGPQASTIHDSSGLDTTR